MKILNIIKGLAGIVLAGNLSLNSAAQDRKYLQGNVHDVKYELTTEKNFPKYELEEQCLFDNHSCYAFWDYSPKEGELNFWVSNRDEESMTFQKGKPVKIDAPKYIPTKVAEIANITNMAIEKTSFEKLKRRAKEKQYFGFSVDITDKDLKFALPDLVIKGTSYIVLREVLDNSDEQTDLPFYIIPKTDSTKVFFPSESFTESNGYPVDAKITCDEKGGVFQPILNIENYENPSSQFSPENTSNQEEQEEWQGNAQKTNYMKYREEQELQKQKGKTLEQKTIQTPQKTQIKKEEEKDTCYYVIKPEDKGYWGIAGKILKDEKRYIEIQNLNPNIKSKDIKVGQKILVPCK